MMGRLRGEGEIIDEATCRQRLKDLQGKKNEDISSAVTRRASEKIMSYVQKEITEEEVEDWIPSAAAVAWSGSFTVMVAVGWSAHTNTTNYSQ